MYAEVCFPFSLDKTFTYKAPSKIASYLNPGTLVVVLFNNKQCNGLVISLSNSTKFKGHINSIISINRNTLIPKELWDTIIWSSRNFA